MKLASLGPFVAHPNPEEDGEAELAAEAIAEEQKKVQPIPQQRGQGSSLASSASTQSEKEPKLIHLEDFLVRKNRRGEKTASVRIRLKKIKKFRAFEDQRDSELAREMGYSKKI